MGQVVPEWQTRLLARLQSAQTQTVLQRSQWLSSLDEEQDIVTLDLVRQLPSPLQASSQMNFSMGVKACQDDVTQGAVM